MTAVLELSRWPVRGRPNDHGGCGPRTRGKENTPTPPGSWRVLGLPICCLRPVTISQWVRDGNEASVIPVFVCLQCCRVGMREDFG